MTRQVGPNPWSEKHYSLYKHMPQDATELFVTFASVDKDAILKVALDQRDIWTGEKNRVI